MKLLVEAGEDLDLRDSGRGNTRRFTRLRS